MLKTNQQRINLGKLKFGQPHTFYYEIKNSSLFPITVNKIVMGCSSCTQAHIESNLIPPQQSVRLNVTFTPGSTGIQSKHLDVIYNNNTSTLPLKFTATVEK